MLRPFPNYRQTELNWLKRLPDSWGILRTKQVFRLRIQKAPKNNQMELLSIYTHIGVKPRKELEQRGNKASTTDGYWIVKNGDIISNKLLAWMGAVGVSHYEGVTSPAYDILRPIQRCNTDYYHYLFRTPTYLQQFKIRSRGIMDMRLRLYFDQLGQIPVPVPPHGEQDAIVLFLNWKTAQINKFIRNKRRFIELLKEQKQNVINQAVTRGLDPNVKLKPSGVEWIGDIPEHWEVMRIKFLFAEREERKGDTEFKLLSFSRSKGLVPFAEISSKPPSAEDLSKYKVCRPGHFLMNRMQAWSGMFTDVEIEGVVSPDYSVFEPIRPMSVAYFSYLFKTKRHVDEFAMASKGIGDGFNRLYTPAFGAIRTLCPPVDEQNEIVEFIKQETAIIDVATSRAEQEIELMREYRTRLISDVVTGQVDVRGIEVPEVAEDELLALDEDAADADDVIDDEGDMDESD